jgi:hypothetical protein
MSAEPPPAHLFDLTNAFFKRQEKLNSDLGVGDIATHPDTRGDDTEMNWLHMLQEFLPRRYRVSQAFVIDTEGRRSEQNDVVNHDRHFSPLLFEVGRACYIPAESVYAAFEVKQGIDKDHLEYAAGKIATVRSLHGTTAPVPHAGGMYDPIAPRRIIGGILARRSDWSPPFGEPFESCLRDLDAREPDGPTWGLDIGCAVAHGGFTVERDVDTHAIITIDHSESNGALIYFAMRLLKQLQAVGSAPAIDYDVYLRSVRARPEDASDRWPESVRSRPRCPYVRGGCACAVAPLSAGTGVRRVRMASSRRSHQQSLDRDDDQCDRS